MKHMTKLGVSPILSESVQMHDLVSVFHKALHTGQLGRNMPMLLRTHGQGKGRSDQPTCRFQVELAGVREGVAMLHVTETADGAACFDNEVAKMSGRYDAVSFLRADAINAEGNRSKPWFAVAVPLKGGITDCTMWLKQPPTRNPSHTVGFIHGPAEERRGVVPRHAYNVENGGRVYVPAIRAFPAGYIGPSSSSSSKNASSFVGLPVDSYIKLAFKPGLALPIYLGGGVALGKSVEAMRVARRTLRDGAMDTYAKLKAALAMLSTDRVTPDNAMALADSLQDMMGMTKVNKDFSWAAEVQAGSDARDIDRVVASVLFCAMVDGTYAKSHDGSAAQDFIHYCQRVPTLVERYEDRLFQEPNIFTSHGVQGSMTIPNNGHITPTII